LEAMLFKLYVTCSNDCKLKSAQRPGLKKMLCGHYILKLLKPNVDKSSRTV